MTAQILTATGVEAFVAALEEFAAEPVVVSTPVTYTVTPVTGAWAGRPVRTGVSEDEVAPWPTTPPHWIHLPAEVKFASTNAGGSPMPGWVSHSRGHPRLGYGPDAGGGLACPCPRGAGWCRVTRVSVAMTSELDARARRHLLRPDGQEDVCLATYAPSTGDQRTTAVLTDLALPLDGERRVHGNPSFSGRYMVRAASQAPPAGWASP